MKDTERSRLHRPAALAFAGILAAASTLVAGSAAAQISDERARQIALEHVPGTVTDLERDEENGRQVIEVEVRGEDGREREVVIDAGNGRVLTVEEDEDEDDDADSDGDDDADSDAD